MIYDNEGKPNWNGLAEELQVNIEGVGFGWQVNDGPIHVLRHGDGKKVCTISESIIPFHVWIHGTDPGDPANANYSTLTSIIARVRELADKAREPEVPRPVDPAPAEPSFREFLEVFRKWFQSPIGSMGETVKENELDAYLDRALGKEDDR